MNSENNKLCPFCESEMMIIQDNLNNGKPYLECPTCGLRFQIEGFPENPQEIRETEWFGLNICISDIEKNHRSAQNVKFHKNVLTNRLNGDIIYLALKFMSKFAEPTFIISSVEINIGV